MTQALRSATKRLLGPILRPTQESFKPGPGRSAELESSDFGRLFDDHDGRDCNKWLHYLPIYDRLFRHARHTPVRFLEIGVSNGGSLQVWRKFLGPEAVIHGIDVDPACAELNTDDLPVHIGSQADVVFLASVVEMMGGIDVVLDDGSHVAKHQRASFDALFPLLSDGGLYVIEDAHTSYWLRHGGGFRRPGTAIQMAKTLVDGMHGWYHRIPVGRRAATARTEVGSVSFYDSIIAIEKRERTRPISDRRGG